MRPRKKLLLYRADPDRAAVMAYTLRQQPWWAVEVCGSMLELRAVLTDTVFAGALMLDAEEAIQQAVKDAQLSRSLGDGKADAPATQRRFRICRNHETPLSLVLWQREPPRPNRRKENSNGTEKHLRNCDLCA